MVRHLRWIEWRAYCFHHIGDEALTFLVTDAEGVGIMSPTGGIDEAVIFEGARW